MLQVAECLLVVLLIGHGYCVSTHWSTYLRGSQVLPITTEHISLGEVSQTKTSKMDEENDIARRSNMRNVAVLFLAST